MFFYNKYKYKKKLNKNSLDLIEYLYLYKYKLSIQDCSYAIDEFLLNPIWHKSHENFIDYFDKFLIIFDDVTNINNTSRNKLIKYIDYYLFDVASQIDGNKIRHINQLFLLHKICEKITDDNLIDNNNLLEDFYKIINYKCERYHARKLCKKICEAIKIPKEFKIEYLIKWRK